MIDINCTEQNWYTGISAFKYTDPLYGDTMLLKKVIYKMNIHYYYLLNTYKIEKLLVIHPLHKRGLEFTYYYSLHPIIE
jgi:hypothetical protein